MEAAEGQSSNENDEENKGDGPAGSHVEEGAGEHGAHSSQQIACGLGHAGQLRCPGGVGAAQGDEGNGQADAAAHAHGHQYHSHHHEDSGLGQQEADHTQGVDAAGDHCQDPLILKLIAERGNQQGGGNGHELEQQSHAAGEALRKTLGGDDGGQPCYQRVEEQGLDTHEESNPPGQTGLPDGGAGCSLLAASGRGLGTSYLGQPDQNGEGGQHEPGSQGMMPAKAQVSGHGAADAGAHGGVDAHAGGVNACDHTHLVGEVQLDNAGDDDIADGNAHADDSGTQEKTEGAGVGPDKFTGQDQNQAQHHGHGMADSAGELCHKGRNHSKGHQGQGGDEAGNGAGQTVLCLNQVHQGADSGDGSTQVKGNKQNAQDHQKCIFFLHK